jgi:hypothetical protein
MTIREEICAATGKSNNLTAERLVVAANRLSDKAYFKLSWYAQLWLRDAILAINMCQSIPLGIDDDGWSVAYPEWFLLERCGAD